MNHIITTIQQAVLQQQMYNGVAVNLQALPLQAQAPYIELGSYPQQSSRPVASEYLLNGSYKCIEIDTDGDNDDDSEEDQRTLYCGNLDDRVTEEMLYEIFLQAGPIERAHIPKDNNGRQRNFGFITYLHSSAVPFALDLYQGLELFQKKVTIRIQGSDKRQQRQFNDPGVKVPSAQIKTNNQFNNEMSARVSASPTNKFATYRHGRHTLYDSNPYDFNKRNKHENNDLRRRSDTAVIDRNHPRIHHQLIHHNKSDTNRRSEQRNHGKRR